MFTHASHIEKRALYSGRTIGYINRLKSQIGGGKQKKGPGGDRSTEMISITDEIPITYKPLPTSTNQERPNTFLALFQ